MVSYWMSGKKRGTPRTATAQAPDIAHPIRCVSQSTPFEFQKLLWSTDWALSEGQEDELAMRAAQMVVESIKRVCACKL